jgi:hypothetical protein
MLGSTSIPPSNTITDSGPDVGSTPSPNTIRTPEAQQEWDDLKTKLRSLESVWKVEATETERRRQLRLLKVNVKEKQDRGELAKDEIYIPVRVAQDNISKEAAQYISYLTSSRNTVVFKPKKKVMDAMGNELTPESLEQWFTKKCRYAGWEIPHFRVVDGSQSHGWDFAEVSYDETKPGFFAVEHIQHERLWFPEDTENIQDSPILVRVYNLSMQKMKEMFPGAESLEQIKKIFYDKDGTTQVNKSLMPLYKCYYRRDDGVVYTCFMNHDRCDWYVREPKPLFRGRRQVVKDTFSGMVVQTPPIFETRYPIHPLPYMIMEDNRLIRTKGRIFLDEYTQESVSSLVSSIVNGFHRASCLFGSPGSTGPMDASTAIKQLDFKIEPNRLFNQKIEFWHPDYPDPAGLQLVNALITQNKQEAGQTSYATLNRDQPGDRKTAREINASVSQAALLSTVQVTNFALYLKEVYTDCWTITVSQLEQR